jgi:hypothetical protein
VSNENLPASWWTPGWETATLFMEKPCATPFFLLRRLIPCLLAWKPPYLIPLCGFFKKIGKRFMAGRPSLRLT